MKYLKLTASKSKYPLYLDPTEIVSLMRKSKVTRNQHTKNKDQEELNYTVITTNKITSHFVKETPEAIFRKCKDAGITIDILK